MADNIQVLDKRTLARINERPKGRGSPTHAAFGVAITVAVVALLGSYTLAAIVLLVGAAFAFLLYKRNARVQTVVLTYNLSGEMAENFSAIQEACGGLADAERVWRVEGETKDTGAPSYGAALTFNEGMKRSPVEVGPMKMPGVSTNVKVWAIKTGAVSLFFLPEAVLLHTENRYRAVSYDALGVVYRPARGVEGGEVPEDAEVVGETWQHTRADGSPDIRYPNNLRYAVVLYGLLSVTGPQSGIRLLVSNKAAAVRFARAFSVGRSDKRPREGVDTGSTSSARGERARRNAEAEVEKVGSLLKVLGAEPGASQREIDAAYKNKAKVYHPDKVASLAAEVRDMAELRMKEINSAYAELKRRYR